MLYFTHIDCNVSEPIPGVYFHGALQQGIASMLHTFRDEEASAPDLVGVLPVHRHAQQLVDRELPEGMHACTILGRTGCLPWRGVLFFWYPDSHPSTRRRVCGLIVQDGDADAHTYARARLAERAQAI